jgi:hypothetical protein
MNNKRIIKNEPYISKEIINVPTKTQLLHPISSTWIHNRETNPICLTKFHIVNNESKILNKSKCKTYQNNYKDYLYTPPIGLSSTDLLIIYNINSIDNLKNWVKENINLLNYFTLNRGINCWIRVNYDTLKNYNNFLEKIIKKIITKHYRIESDTTITNLETEIKNYIDYWIQKNTLIENQLDLVNDFIIYIRKKYKEKINLI